MVQFSFATGTDGFAAGITDYTPGMETDPNGIQFVSVHRRLPPPLDNQFGYLLGGTNRSDDLFMFIWRAVAGLAPGQAYRVRVDFTIATNVPPNCAGIGGSPGEGVAVKAGASNREPATFIEQNRVRPNFDKDNQGGSGRDVVVAGDFAGGGGTCSQGIYQLKSLSTAGREPIVTADAAGRLWLILGTDSGFEGRTEIYFLSGSATFTPV